VKEWPDIIKFESIAAWIVSGSLRCVEIPKKRTSRFFSPWPCVHDGFI